jgi:hypothetical protein
MLLTIEGRSPLFLDKQETTMTTKTKLTALALAAATFTTASLLADIASAREAHGASGVLPKHGPISGTGTFKTAPVPVRKPPLGDLGGSQGMTGAGGGNAGGTEGVKCESDRDCGIFKN